MNQVHAKGVTSQIFTVTLRSATTGQRLGGVLYSAVTINAHRQGASVSSISPVTMTAGTWVSGGWVETSVTGVYQFGAPNAALAAGAEFVKFSITASGAIDKDIDVVLIDADLRNATSLGLSNLSEAVPAIGDIRDELERNGGLLDQTFDAAAGAESAASAASVSSASVDSKLSTGRLAKVDTLPDTGIVARTGDAMTLTTGERTALADEVERQIIDETDSEKVLQAFVNKIAAANPSLGDLTLAAIASAVRTNLATELARIDADISSRSTYAGADTAGTTTLLARLTATRAGNLDNLDDSVASAVSEAGSAALAAGLASVAATAAAEAVASVLAKLAAIQGDGWTNETLVALYAKEVEVDLSDEQIQELGDRVSDSIGQEGLTVSGFSDVARQQLRSTLSGAVIRLRGPIDGAGKLMELVRGDDYRAEDGRAIEFDYVGSTLPDLTGAAVTLRLRSGLTVAIAGSVIVPTGAAKTVRFEPTREQTLQLSAGVGKYEVEIVDGAAHHITPLETRGELVVKPQLG